MQSTLCCLLNPNLPGHTPPSSPPRLAGPSQGMCHVPLGEVGTATSLAYQAVLQSARPSSYDVTHTRACWWCVTRQPGFAVIQWDALLRYHRRVFPRTHAQPHL